MSQPEAPKIEFPCANYPVKVLGHGKDDYEAVILEIVRIHAPDLDVERISVRDSKNGRFRALTVYITATGIDQLQNLHQDLMAHEYVHMVI
ncbi:MAG: hypothetical protein CMI08_13670 [Oceanospirillaceae bacterium]|uniref:YbeD family protein n=1 Tax=unclassified Thalassolituus TaxID=2624967 RepID=UPI000C0AE952|nr:MULTISPECIES: DUF493 family protein [unclassified Thalassolituus]MAK91958.1 hypothetical protein [Thalassolituus sp.]MAY00220.1 hypothetical protein [Oceanospirillaceae bacterium]MBL34372.1 hypothetical protein [Oceanospirillaceae bacterium]MBS54783.1 hypothetical protein [Oceanospirillaceae bacterium]